tara:strand:+ start:1221 stop:2879 length:1659 start_codon:yes stop_codon:yes gene_type:complete
MAVKSWQLGYDATTGNFVELDDIAAADPNDPRRVAFENQVTAIMEQKGLLASQAQQYVANAYAQGTTLDALKHTSVQTGTAEERGDVWGASDDTKGKSFLKAQEDATVTTGDWKTNAALIEKLYTEGFGREADTAGLQYWTEQLTDGNMSYAKIAESFGMSEEAQVRDVYHQEYGRDVDDAGLQYWLSTDDAVGHATRVLQDSSTTETKIRDLHASHLGQFSTEAERQANIAAGGFWTDAQEGGYKNLDWRDFTATKKDEAGNIIQGSGQTGTQTDFGDLRYDFGTDETSPFGTGDDLFFGATGQAAERDAEGNIIKTGVERFRASVAGEQDATSSFSGNTISSIDDVRNILQRREDLMNISSTYDVDDTEGGSGIGRIFTLKEMEPYMHEAAEEDGTLKTLAEKLGAEKWAILTKELTKVPGPDGPIKGQVMFDPGTNPDERDTNRNTLSNNYQVPVPPDYQSPDLANVNRQNVDYMPDLDGTVPNRPLRKLDSSYTTAPQQAVRKQGAFVAGTSAKGVRRRQSSAARSGRSAMGTKQLARNNMQIKSLNI